MKILRIRCPFCGHMPAEHELKEEPSELRIYEEELGGKRKLNEEEIIARQRQLYPWTRVKAGYPGCAPGLIEYRDITDERPDLLEKWRSFFTTKMKKVR